jgi:hypothetical protein
MSFIQTELNQKSRRLGKNTAQLYAIKFERINPVGWKLILADRNKSNGL